MSARLRFLVAAGVILALAAAVMLFVQRSDGDELLDGVHVVPASGSGVPSGQATTIPAVPESDDVCELGDQGWACPDDAGFSQTVQEFSHVPAQPREPTQNGSPAPTRAPAQTRPPATPPQQPAPVPAPDDDDDDDLDDDDADDRDDDDDD